MKVRLLAFTPASEEIISKAARLCYSESGIDELDLSPRTQARMVRKMFTLGHHSTLEHASFTFGIEGISRACSHQLVRHRLASFSQQSQRYVKFGAPFDYYIPSSISRKKKLKSKYEKVMRDLAGLYQELCEAGVPAEDARYILPNACETKIIVTMNARELLHFFNLRLCSRAQKEIRDVASAMLVLAKEKAPHIFSKAGPTCVSYGYCKEEAEDCPLYQKLIKK